MFFFNSENDLDFELRTFVVDPKLASVAERARQQREEFVNRFPLKCLNELRPEDVWGGDTGHDDFFHWITDKTKYTTNRLPWAKVRLGLENGMPQHATYLTKSRMSSHGYGERREYFYTTIRNHLLPFLYSHGREKIGEAQACFGQPLLLKALYLYYPNDFSNIAAVGWIDEITSAFIIDYGYTVYERSANIRQFIVSRAAERVDITNSYLGDFLVEYLGLKGETKGFHGFLIQQEGLSDDVAERYCRALRQLSRLLVGFGVIKNSLMKISAKELHERRDEFLGNLVKRIDIISKLVDYEQALSEYVAFTESRSSTNTQFYTIPFQPFSLAGRKEQKDSAVRKNDTRRKSHEWAKALRQAKDPNGVVNILLQSGITRPYYRHYTTFSSFLYVADEWMFRLTRGDDPGMNDQLEWKRLGDAALWKRTFIGSFSCIEGESTAMWGLYGKPSNEAIRLSFSSQSMHQWLEYLKQPKVKLPHAQFFGVNGEPGKKVNLKWSDIQICFGDVIYGGNIVSSGVTESTFVFRGKRLRKDCFKDFNQQFEKSQEVTGFIKSIDWAYEDEARLVVRVNEQTILPDEKSVADIQYVFVPIPKEVLAMVEYMKGPCVTPKLRPIIDESLRKLFTSPVLAESRYMDNLKFK